MTMDKPPSEDLHRLLRWHEAGGTWRVAARSNASVTVSLCRCDGGEEMDRLSSSDNDLLEYLAGRSSSEDFAPERPAGET